MRKQMIWLLAILTVTALVSLAERIPEPEAKTDPPTAETPLPEPPDVEREPWVDDSDWAPAGWLTRGQVLCSTEPTLKISSDRALSLQQPVRLDSSTAYFQVDVGVADHRWTRYQPMVARVEEGRILLECRVVRYTKPHIQNYVQSPASTNVVSVSGLQGRYEVRLGNRTVGYVIFPNLRRLDETKNSGRLSAQ